MTRGVKRDSARDLTNRMRAAKENIARIDLEIAGLVLAKMAEERLIQFLERKMAEEAKA
jgi:hypothetical protein